MTDHDLARLTDELRWRDLLEPFAAIATAHGALLTETFSRSRTKHIAAARHACWRYLRTRGWSYPAIAKLFGVDHSTVMKSASGRRGRARARATVPDLLPTPSVASTSPASIPPSGPIADARELGWTAAHDRALARAKGAA